MTLSIITINLNNCNGLQHTIESVISQTFSDYEWIVIDGGSTDGSRELIEKHSSNFKYWTSEPDKGIYNAMNKALPHVSGEWILFLNSGDWLCEDTTLEKVFCEKHNCDVLYGNTYLMKDSVKTPCYFPSKLKFTWILNDGINHQSTFYKSNLFTDFKFDEEFAIMADRALIMELMLGRKIFKHLNQFIACYDSTGLSTQSNGLFFDELVLLHKKYIPYHLEDDIQYIYSWRFIENRKSLRILKKIFVTICKAIDKILNKIERSRRK